MTPKEHAVAKALRRHVVHPSVVEDIAKALELNGTDSKLFRMKAVGPEVWFASTQEGFNARLNYIATGRLGS